MAVQEIYPNINDCKRNANIYQTILLPVAFYFLTDSNLCLRDIK